MVVSGVRGGGAGRGGGGGAGYVVGAYLHTIGMVDAQKWPVKVFSKIKYLSLEIGF